MTQITKVEKIVDEMIERKIASLVWSKNASDLNKTLVNGNIRGFKTEIIDALTAQRTALLTELRGEIEDELQLLSRAYAGLETLPEKSANLAIRDSFIKLLSSLMPSPPPTPKPTRKRRSTRSDL